MSSPQRSSHPYDPAASMSLLTQLLMNPLDSGYYQYGKQERPRTLWQKVLVLLLSVVLGVAGISAISSLRSPSRLDVEDSLGEQVEKKRESVEELATSVDQLRERVEAKTSLEGALVEQMEPGTALATSTGALSGQGLRVTVREAPSVGIDTPIVRQGAGKIRDHDLRMIVNALWGGGAEAITINGLRLGPGSFIRTAGQSILVNITPIQAPYVIEAIGDGPTLSVAIVQGETGDYLSSVESAHGITISTQAVKDLTVPEVKLRALRYTQLLKE